MRLLVGDGFDLDGVVEAIPGLCPEVRFKYRPALDLALDKVNMAISAEARYAAKAEAIAAHLIGPLQAVNDDKTLEAVVMTADTIKQLPAPVFRAIYSHVMGFVGPSVAEAAKN